MMLWFTLAYDIEDEFKLILTVFEVVFVVFAAGSDFFFLGFPV